MSEPLHSKLVPAEWDGHPCVRVEAYLEAAAHAERAEADLADEKRRHAGLRAGVEALADEWGLTVMWVAASLRALLDTATEETQGAP